MFFKQIKSNGDNFSYIIADDATKEAAVVDSSFNKQEIAKIIKSNNLNLKYIINTHGHSDHTAGNQELQKIFGGKIVAHRMARVNLNLVVDEGDVLKLGSVSIKIIYTPGHTPDGICLLIDGKKLLTGDTLFVGECGRTDFSGGNPKSMYDSLFNKILKLADDVEVYPGHDYGAKPNSTVRDERRSNYTLRPRSVEEFVEFMQEP